MNRALSATSALAPKPLWKVYLAILVPMIASNFLQALIKTGVAVCGGPVIVPLAGRTEAPGSRN